MTCYNIDCIEYKDCDVYKQATCIKKMSKSRFIKKTQVIPENKFRCPRCKQVMEVGHYVKSRKKLLICPTCNIKIE